MQIGSDVHNYMETLVAQALHLPEYLQQYENEQLADIACLALNQLKPVYIRHDIDFLTSLEEHKLRQLMQSADIAVKNAAKLVKEDKRISPVR